MSQSFELRIIEDGTHSSDHSCLIGLRFDMEAETFAMLLIQPIDSIKQFKA